MLSSVIALFDVKVTVLSPSNVKAAAGKVPEKSVSEPAFTIAPEISIPSKTAALSPASIELIVIVPEPVIVLLLNLAAVDIKPLPAFMLTVLPVL